LAELLGAIFEGQSFTFFLYEGGKGKALKAAEGKARVRKGTSACLRWVWEKGKILYGRTRARKAEKSNQRAGRDKKKDKVL